MRRDHAENRHDILGAFGCIKKFFDDTVQNFV